MIYSDKFYFYGQNKRTKKLYLKTNVLDFRWVQDFHTLSRILYFCRGVARGGQGRAPPPFCSTSLIRHSLSTRSKHFSKKITDPLDNDYLLLGSSLTKKIFQKGPNGTGEVTVQGFLDKEEGM